MVYLLPVMYGLSLPAGMATGHHRILVIYRPACCAGGSAGLAGRRATA